MKDQSFEVGQRYENRAGEYEVVKIDNGDMVIRYDDGTEIETTTELQARILRNIQMEQDIRRKRRQQKKRKHRRRRRSRLGPAFDGLEPTDFKESVRGTSWRRRSELGGLVALRLSEIGKTEFSSWAVQARPRVHIAKVEHYERRESEEYARYFVALDEEQVRYGLSVEQLEDQGGGAAWSRFIDLLSADEEAQQALSDIWEEFDLHVDVVTADREELITTLSQENDELIWQSGEKEDHVKWPDLKERLQDLETTEPCCLRIYSTLTKAEALAKGEDIDEAMMPVMEELLPIYQAVAK